MKNIAVLSILVIIIGTSTGKISAYSQETENNENEANNTTQKSGQYSLSIVSQYGYVKGQAFELVYQGDTDDELLSELIWDMKPVHYLGVQLDFGRRDLMSKPGFFASASLRAGIPGDSGIMEDRDWDKNLMLSGSEEPSHFSSHTNKTIEFYWMDLFLGASIPFGEYFYIKPFFSGTWMHFSFSGRDGYGIYPPPTGSVTFDGEVIRYKQDWILIATGFYMSIKIYKYLSFDFSFRISPFAYCEAVDNHLVDPPRNYHDFSYNGLFLEPKAAVSFTHDFFGFSIEAAYCHIGKTRGQSYINSGSGNFYNGNTVGASLTLIDIRFLIMVLKL